MSLKNLITKYQNMQAPVKASLWFLICGFLQKGISLIATPIFTRVMTAAEYGRYNVYVSWFNFVQIIATLYLQRVFIPAAL